MPRTLVKCGYVDADFERLKCEKIWRRLSVDIMGSRGVVVRERVGTPFP